MDRLFVQPFSSDFFDFQNGFFFFARWKHEINPRDMWNVTPVRAELTPEQIHSCKQTGSVSLERTQAAPGALGRSLSECWSLVIADTTPRCPDIPSGSSHIGWGGGCCLSSSSCWRRNKWKTGSGDGAEACVRQTEARRYWSVCQTRQLGGGLEGRQTSPLSLLRRCTLGLKVHPATLTMECAHCEKNHRDRAGTEGFFFPLSRMTRDSEGQVCVTQCAECIKNTIHLSYLMLTRRNNFQSKEISNVL